MNGEMAPAGGRRQGGRGDEALAGVGGGFVGKGCVRWSDGPEGITEK